MDVETIVQTTNDGLQFLETGPPTDEMAQKKRELESKFNPIMMRVYQQAGPAARAAAEDEW